MDIFKRFFTLIELIVVIVVLGVLAAIVIPNISSTKDEATGTAIASDIRSIQTAVDMQQLEEQELPALKEVKFGESQLINFAMLVPEYLRERPNQGYFWVDHNKKVYGAAVDAPPNVTVTEDGEDAEITWGTVEGAVQYEVFKAESEVQSNASQLQLISVGKTKDTTFTGESGEEYLVASQDRHGNWTPAVNGNYNPNMEDYYNPEKVVTSPNDNSDANDLDQLALGDYVKFGEFNSHDIVWNVVKQEDNKVMLFMTEPIKDTGGYYLQHSFDAGNSNDWETSDLRNWLNGDFYETAFTNKEVIADTVHDYVISTSRSAEADSGTVRHTYEPTFSQSVQNYDAAYKKEVTDQVFLVSIPELVNNIEPEIGSNYYNSPYFYWTRDSGDMSSSYVRTVVASGGVSFHNALYVSGRVRAALSLKSGILKSGDGTEDNPYIIE